mmetsp:Transcript_9880/g.11836  ORF Transcript_9880/g.11836 Transcript_9880/m.11836 type:complete len:388 (+) Transcript_9880:208-1371(+)
MKYVCLLVSLCTVHSAVASQIDFCPNLIKAFGTLRNISNNTGEVTFTNGFRFPRQVHVIYDFFAYIDFDPGDCPVTEISIGFELSVFGSCTNIDNYNATSSYKISRTEVKVDEPYCVEKGFRVTKSEPLIFPPIFRIPQATERTVLLSEPSHVERLSLGPLHVRRVSQILCSDENGFCSNSFRHCPITIDGVTYQVLLGNLLPIDDTKNSKEILMMICEYEDITSKSTSDGLRIMFSLKDIRFREINDADKFSDVKIEQGTLLRPGYDPVTSVYSLNIAFSRDHILLRQNADQAKASNNIAIAALFFAVVAAVISFINLGIVCFDRNKPTGFAYSGTSQTIPTEVTKLSTSLDKLSQSFVEKNKLVGVTITPEALADLQKVQGKQVD